MATFKAVILKNHERKDCKYLLQIRVYNIKPGYVRTGFYVQPDDFEKGILKDVYLRSVIDTKIIEYTKLINDRFGVATSVTGADMANFIEDWELKKCKKEKKDMDGIDILDDFLNLIFQMQKDKTGIFKERKAVIDHLKKHLNELENNEEVKLLGAIDFIVEFEELIEQKKINQSRGVGNYEITLNHLKRYLRSLDKKDEEQKEQTSETDKEQKEQTPETVKLSIQDVTCNFLRKFEDYLRLQCSRKGFSGKRCLSLSMSCLRRVFNYAKEKYNDEDKKIIIIQHYPFDNYQIKPNKNTKSQAISVDHLLDILNAETELRRDILAKDAFSLSFYLAGMNLVDLYKVKKTAYQRGRLSYNRSKTEETRDDDAFITFLVPDEVKPLMKKYADTSEEYLFDFHNQYSCEENFRRAVNTGLNRISKNAGYPAITSYSARYTVARLASQLGVNDGDISILLNHASEHKTTEIYTGRDYAKIDDILRLVIDFISKPKNTKKGKKKETEIVATATKKTKISA